MKRPQGYDTTEVSIANYEDVVIARQKTRELMERMGFSLLDQTRIVTVVSELARNIVVHAKRGRMVATLVVKDNAEGLQCAFEDQGPGIPDIELAMKDGFSTSNSLGLGLSGARRICRQFEISSIVGKGTRIKITEWL